MSDEPLGKNRGANSIAVAAYIQGLGLSQSEAARYVGVRPDTMASWCSGRRTPAPSAIANLHALAGLEQRMAQALAEAMSEAIAAAGGRLPESIDLCDFDEAAAQEAGLPSAGAYRAVIRRLWEILPAGANIRLVTGDDAAASAARRLRRMAAG